MSEGQPLPIQPPRDYRFRDTYARRPWRDPGAAICRDLAMLAVGGGLAGVAKGELEFLLLGVMLALVMYGIGQGFTWLANRRRLQLLRTAPAVRAILLTPKRVFLLREMFRGERDRTFALRYRFDLPDGTRRQGAVWICGCAREAFPRGSEIWLAYDPEHPRRSLPLRLAVMRVPKR